MYLNTAKTLSLFYIDNISFIQSFKNNVWVRVAKITQEGNTAKIKFIKSNHFDYSIEMTNKAIATDMFKSEMAKLGVNSLMITL